MTVTLALSHLVDVRNVAAGFAVSIESRLDSVRSGLAAEADPFRRLAMSQAHERLQEAGKVLRNYIARFNETIAALDPNAAAAPDDVMLLRLSLSAQIAGEAGRRRGARFTPTAEAALYDRRYVYVQTLLSAAEGARPPLTPDEHAQHQGMLESVTWLDRVAEHAADLTAEVMAAPSYEALVQIDVLEGWP